MRYDRDTLYELYIVQELSIKQIAAQIGGNAGCINTALHRFGIPVRPRGSIYPKGKKHGITKEQLEHEYVTLRKTQKEIASLFGCGETLISNLMLQYGIPARPRKEHLKGTTKTIEHRMKLSDAKRGKRLGHKNHKWKGGVSIDHDRIRRTREHVNWRQFVLRIKGDICELCGKDLNERCHCCGHRPDKHVHHIKEFADNPDLRFDINNALVVCESCHKSLHKK